MSKRMPGSTARKGALARERAARYNATHQSSGGSGTRGLSPGTRVRDGIVQANGIRRR